MVRSIRRIFSSSQLSSETRPWSRNLSSGSQRKLPRLSTPSESCWWPKLSVFVSLKSHKWQHCENIQVKTTPLSASTGERCSRQLAEASISLFWPAPRTLPTWLWCNSGIVTSQGGWKSWMTPEPVMISLHVFNDWWIMIFAGYCRQKSLTKRSFPFQLVLCHLLKPLLQCSVVPPFKTYPITFSEGLNLSPIASIVRGGTLTLFLPGTEPDNCFDDFSISSLPVCALTITSWMDAKVCARSFRRNANVVLRRRCHSGAQRCQTYRDFKIAWWPVSLTLAVCRRVFQRHSGRLEKELIKVSPSVGPWQSIICFRFFLRALT